VSGAWRALEFLGWVVTLAVFGTFLLMAWGVL
jgi:hypothetical protein